jgi:hypothetical protein
VSIPSRSPPYATLAHHRTRYYGTGAGGGGGGGGSTPPKKFHTIYLRLATVSGHHKLLGRIPTYRGRFQIQRKIGGGKFKFYTRTTARNPGGTVRIQVKDQRARASR